MSIAANNFAPQSQRAMARRALELPPLPAAWEPLFADFITLDRRRPPAFAGIAPLPISEIVAFGEALRFGYAAHELEAMIELDAIRMRVNAQKVEDVMTELSNGD